MITSLYYYNYYRPRILKSSGSTFVKQMPFKQTLAYAQEKPYNLTAAYKDDVINYAKQLSDTVNETKTSTMETISIIDNMFSDDAKKEAKGLKKHNKDKDAVSIKSLKRALKDLSGALNKTVDFKSQSEEFNEYSQNIKEIVSSSDSLRDLGLVYEDGGYTVDPKKVSNLNPDELEDILKDSYDSLKGIYSNTSEFLRAPLSKHMAFKSFSYYYSYGTGIIKNDSFNLISTGTLLNLQL